MKIKSLILLLMFVGSASAADKADDWRSNASVNEKVQNLIEVMPSASVIMLQMGERYKNLYWAAKQEKWDFAEYQMEEMRELVNMLIITRPGRAETAKMFRTAVFEKLTTAVESRKWNQFEKGFELLRTECMQCHARNDHAFITLPIPKSANSPVLNMP